jgi:hypothetical protein
MEALSRIALAALRKEKTLDALAIETGVPRWLIVNAVVRIVQGAQEIVSDGELFPERTGEQQRQGADQSRLCFVHIEKTSGQTLASHLEDMFDARDVCPAVLHGDLEALAMSEDLKAFQLLHGHYFLAWLLEVGLSFTNTRFVTFVRHPLARQVSSYKHWIGEPGASDYVNQLLGGFNIQCIRLSTLSMRKGYASMRDHLNSAKEALQRFFFVGLSEEFNEGISALMARLGYPVSPQAREINVSTVPTPELPAALRDEIRAGNWADLELYEYAVTLYRRSMEGAWRTGAVDPATWFRPQRSIHFTMNQPLLGSGWHIREGVGHESLPTWRWSGPEVESRLLFHVNREESYRVAVRVLNSLTPEILASLSFFINEHSLDMRTRMDGRPGMLYEGTVPASALAEGTPNAALILRLSETRRFSEIDPRSGDHRRCGVAVSEVSFSPASESVP